MNKYSLRRYLRNVSVEGDTGKPHVEFTPDGVLKAAELKIMNLRPGVSKQLVWEDVRTTNVVFKLCPFSNNVAHN